MEAAGLYMNAARAGKRALGLFTISDHIYRAEELTSEQPFWSDVVTMTSWFISFRGILNRVLFRLYYWYLFIYKI